MSFINVKWSASKADIWWVHSFVRAHLGTNRARKPHPTGRRPETLLDGISEFLLSRRVCLADVGTSLRTKFETKLKSEPEGLRIEKNQLTTGVSEFGRVVVTPRLETPKGQFENLENLMSDRMEQRPAEQTEGESRASNQCFGLIRSDPTMSVLGGRAEDICVPRLTTSPVAPGRRADADRQVGVGDSNCAGKTGRSRRR
jgi:hypothetical protein